MENKLRVGVVGLGHLGAHHARVYSLLPNASLVGCSDINQELAENIAKKFHSKAFTNYKDLFGKVDAVSIVTPTALHYQIAKDFLEAGINVLIEKPITKSLEEADKLLEIQKNKNLILQVGHIERFNPAISAIADVINEPIFIECHRLSTYLKRAIEVGVVLDLMIHDIDIILELINSDVESIEAIGGNILSKTEDVANVRIKFKNGAVANITASRMAYQAKRKIRIFQKDAYIVLDYINQGAYLFKKEGDKITRHKLDAEKIEPLKKELESFVDCVINKKRPIVSGEEARKALAVAIDITKKIQSLKYGN